MELLQLVSDGEHDVSELTAYFSDQVQRAAVTWRHTAAAAVERFVSRH